MPLYDYECQTCGKRDTAIKPIAERNKGPACCGGAMKKIITAYWVHPDFEPYLDENLHSEPVWVKSKQHRKELMNEYNVYEKYGKGWM